MLQFLTKAIRKQEGQAMVELAFVLPILLILVFGIIEFGSIYYAQLTINNASREGARHGAIRATTMDFNKEEIIDKVKNSSTSLDNDNMDISISPESDEDLIRGNDLAVKIEYDRQLLTPIMGWFISDSDNPGHISLGARNVMRIE